MNKKSQRKEIWSRYWLSGVTDSCVVEEQSSSISNRLDDYWSVLLDGVNQDSKLLDLCSGNGTLIKRLIRLEDSRDCGYKLYVGIDQANTSPDWVGSNKSKITFEQGSIEELPFEDNSFDTITSQFGIEYCITEKSVSEIMRVAKENLQLQFLIHAKDSCLTRTAKNEIKHIKWLLSPENILGTQREMLTILSNLQNPKKLKKIQRDEVANKLRVSYNSKLKDLQSKARGSENPDVLWEALEIFAQLNNYSTQNGHAEAQRQLNKYKRELNDYLIRLNELVQVGSDDEDITRIQDMFSAYDTTLVVDKLREGTDIIGYTLRSL